MKLICSLHLKKAVEILSLKYVQVGARLHHFNRRLKKQPLNPLVFRDFCFLSLGPLARDGYFKPQGCFQGIAASKSLPVEMPSPQTLQFGSKLTSN